MLIHQSQSTHSHVHSTIMPATAAASPWKKSSSSSQSHSRTARPSTTPRAHGHPISVGQAIPPLLSPDARSLQSSKDQFKSSSPSYFGLVGGGGREDPAAPDSNPGTHARQNWQFASSRSPAQSPNSRHIPAETNPEFEAFRRQSEQNGFNFGPSLAGLNRPSQSRTTSDSSTFIKSDHNKATSPSVSRPRMDRSVTASDIGGRTVHKVVENRSFLDMPRRDSPAAINTSRVRAADHTNARLSLPPDERRSVAIKAPVRNVRSETLPESNEKDGPSMMTVRSVAELLENTSSILLLDLRVYQQYANSRIRGALNLCIPTTLLKRPSFTVQKLADTFSSDRDREMFDKWRDCRYIVVYDANSSQSKEALTPLNVLKKFTSEGWTGQGVVVKGGFHAFSKTVPDFVDKGSMTSGSSPSNQPLSIAPPLQDTVPVAGGCYMPNSDSAVNPFFGTIRQNMDLLDGVGQLPVQMPAGMTDRMEYSLPSWLQQASVPKDEGRMVSNKFLSLEKLEQRRMQQALNANVSYGTPGPDKRKQIQIAGIEKGSKNRYNNIFPYDHTRVHLQDITDGDCDYVNANHVRSQYSNRHYIATQAPIPATFGDFWRVVWEQDVRVIVMLTAEAEGGQVKSHNYWNPGEYGPLKLKKLSERSVHLESKHSGKSSPVESRSRPGMGQRRSTTHNVAGDKKTSDKIKTPSAEVPVVVVRHFTLSHSSFPFQPMREITQLHYSQWPDFGAPASPTALLGLVEQVNKYVRSSSSPSDVVGQEEAAPEGQRPVVVHCSAGCGRTGTFCTIDSVIDMLKRQHLERADDDDSRMEVDSDDDWMQRDDVDLVAKTVGEFRQQRLSMVQNLRQFVLCYETVLQWLAGQHPDSLHGSDGSRRSYQG